MRGGPPHHNNRSNAHTVPGVARMHRRFLQDEAILTDLAAASAASILAVASPQRWARPIIERALQITPTLSHSADRCGSSALLVPLSPLGAPVPTLLVVGMHNLPDHGGPMIAHPLLAAIVTEAKIGVRLTAPRCREGATIPVHRAISLLPETQENATSNHPDCPAAGQSTKPQTERPITITP